MNLWTFPVIAFLGTFAITLVTAPTIGLLIFGLGFLAKRSCRGVNSELSSG